MDENKKNSTNKFLMRIHNVLGVIAIYFALFLFNRSLNNEVLFIVLAASWLIPDMKNSHKEY